MKSRARIVELTQPMELLSYAVPLPICCCAMDFKKLSSSNFGQVVKKSNFNPNSNKVFDDLPPREEKSKLDSMKELRDRTTSSVASNPDGPSISHGSGEETTGLSQLERKSTTPKRLLSSSSSKKLLKSESKKLLKSESKKLLKSESKKLLKSESESKSKLSESKSEQQFEESKSKLEKKTSKSKLRTSSKLFTATRGKTPSEPKATLTRTSTSKTASSEKLPREGKRDKTTSERSNLTHTHAKNAAYKLVPISEQQSTQFNPDYSGDDVIRIQIGPETINEEVAKALEEAKEELGGDAVPKNDTFLRQDDFTPKTLAFWAAQRPDNAIEQSLVEVFKESARNTTKFARYNTQNGVLEVNEAILSKEERQELRSQITNVFNHIFKNADKVLSPASLELLKEAARFIEDKGTYPTIKATASSVLFLRILQPMLDQYVHHAQKSGATDKELCAMRYIQQTVMTFASNPTKPLSKAKNPSPAKLKFFKDLKKELAPNLALFMETLLGDLSVIKT
jgi:hypothetical protein